MGHTSEESAEGDVRSEVDSSSLTLRWAPTFGAVGRAARAPEGCSTAVRPPVLGGTKPRYVMRQIWRGAGETTHHHLAVANRRILRQSVATNWPSYLLVGSPSRNDAPSRPAPGLSSNGCIIPPIRWGGLAAGGSRDGMWRDIYDARYRDSI